MGTIGLVPKETWQARIGRWKRRRDGRFGSFPFLKLKSQNPKRRAPWRRTEASNRRSILSKRKRGPISSLHLRLLSSTGVSVGVCLPIERSQLPIESLHFLL
ncbi:hypothetical protein HID58_023879 [Brassica napus]|uniref:Uncharacterized protein n=1 Tax=Brassica napus TaxID=3708 RepID=A0ABQ8D3K7_BRANA|nr:hypothetical protein HID58_023879 [Brassica napus]